MVSFSTTLSSDPRAIQSSTHSVSTQPIYSEQSSSTANLAQRVNIPLLHHSAGSTALHKPAPLSEGIGQNWTPHHLLPSPVDSQSAGAEHHDLRHSGTQLLAGLQSRLAVTQCIFHLHHFQLYASLLQICGQTILQLAILPALYQCEQHVPGSIVTCLEAVHIHLDSLSTTQLKVGLPWQYAVYS